MYIYKVLNRKHNRKQPIIGNVATANNTAEAVVRY